MKLFTVTLIALAAAASAGAQSTASTASPKVRHVIGLDNIKRDATGQLTVQDGALRFNAGKAEDKVPIASIDDIFIGTETTQSGGKTGRTVKIVAIAAPYESGKVLTTFDADQSGHTDGCFSRPRWRAAWRYLRGSDRAGGSAAHAD